MKKVLTMDEIKVLVEIIKKTPPSILRERCVKHKRLKKWWLGFKDYILPAKPGRDWWVVPVLNFLVNQYTIYFRKSISRRGYYSWVLVCGYSSSLKLEKTD